MKRISIFTALWLVASVCAVKAQVGDKAMALVQKTLEQIYDNETAQVWESFSEPSKDEYRLAVLDSLSASRETWKPGKEPPVAPFQYDLRSDEERRKDEADRKIPYWEKTLKRMGFLSNLDSVKALSNHDFWEAFLSEQYLKDKRPHDPVAPMSFWPKGKSRVPLYQVEGVAVSGDRFYVIMMVPLKLKNVMQSLAYESRVWWSQKEHDDYPDERLVWSGRTIGGQLQLDVPENVVGFHKRNAFARRHSGK
ncbi:MAG: hypothetical protein V4689_07710 [Verrucomicrobiota bacterium]